MSRVGEHLQNTDRDARRIDISTFVLPEPPAASIPAPKKPERSWSTLLGILGTLSLHFLGLQAIVLGAAPRKTHVPEGNGAGATEIKASVEAADTLVLITIPDPSSTSDDVRDEIASHGVTAKDLPIQIANPDPTPATNLADAALTDVDTPVTVDADEMATRAVLYGQYTGQIRARIERAWRKPRSPVTGAAESVPLANSQEDQSVLDQIFQCDVQIVQDALGYVQEILLPKCNGSAEWQRSLVMAIQQASPLPVPPSPKVFTSTLAVSFSGFSFGPGAAEDDYAPAQAPTIANLSSASSPTRLLPSGLPPLINTNDATDPVAPK